jgi:hypothetical protein
LWPIEGKVSAVGKLQPQMMDTGRQHERCGDLTLAKMQVLVVLGNPCAGWNKIGVHQDMHVTSTGPDCPGWFYNETFVAHDDG